MQPVLMIGCGGSGTKAVRHVRAAVERRLLEIDWEDEVPSCWQFLGIDTPTTQEASSEIPPLPHGDYLSIGSRHRSYPALYRALEAAWAAGKASSAIELVSGWLPDPSKASFPLSKGAGQTRAIGRAAALDSFPRTVTEPMQAAFREIRGSRADLDKATRALGYEVSGDRDASSQDPLVVVCTSIGGGTGAGIALDVIDTLRAIDSGGSHPVLVLFANDIFDLDTKEALAANSLAFLSEMMAAYWSENDEIASPISVASTSQNPGCGPHAVFLLSREQHGGASFGTTAEIYLAAGEVLATWVTSEIVQEQIINFLVANWQNNAALNYGGYPFGQNSQQAVISSFGVSQVSVGRDRFARWAEHKLARATMDTLIQGHLRYRSHRDAALTDEDWVLELGHKHAAAVFDASGATDGSDRRGLSSVEEFYAPQQAAADHHAEARSELLAAIPAGASMPASALHEHLRNRATRIKSGLMEDTTRDAERAWRQQAASDTCTAVSEIAAVTSLPVAAAAVETARRDMVRRMSASLRERSSQAAAAYREHVESGLNLLKAATGDLNAKSDATKRAVEQIAAGLACCWQERRLLQAAETLEHADLELLEEILNCLHAVSNAVARNLDDEQVVKWPQADEPGISSKYHPSAVEFPMEDHSDWNARLRELCKEAADPAVGYGDLPIDPVRYRMVAGHKDEIPPLLHMTEGAAWTPGMSAPIEASGEAEEWLERFRMWANKPGSNYRRYVSEGLGDFLAANDKYTGQRRPDHPDRIARFRESLLSAKDRSKPMMRLSPEVYHATHDKLPDEQFFRQMFPFKDGHPAAAVVDEVLGENGWHPSLLDMTSIMLTSYFESPVHPIVVASLTEPIAAALTSYSDVDKRAHSFWQWRRARRLDAFVPLPRILLERIVRGFAIARLCGLMTVDTDRAAQILDPQTWEPAEFPWPLLTRPMARSDILAVLLEGLSACYGAVPTEGPDAFKAYHVLHDLGLNNEMSRHDDVLRAFLREGDSALRATLDTPQARGASDSERLAAAEKYLITQETRSRQHQTANAEQPRLRDRSGLAERGVPTGEMADVYLKVYPALRESLVLDHVDDDI